jgi:hypothetical protein
MRFKAFALAITMLLAAGVAMIDSVEAVAPPGPQLTCIKAQSDVALHLRVTNNSGATIATGKKISYSYKTSAGSPQVSGLYTLQTPLAAGQSRSFFVFPQAAQDTPIYQCQASVQQFAQAQPKNP